MDRLIKEGNASEASVSFSLSKTLRNIGALVIGLLGLVVCRDISALIVCVIMGYSTMYLGVVAYHRLLIHRSFRVPRYFEYALVFAANFSGMGGPLSLIKIHDIRDWAQRKSKCHSYFCHSKPILIDAFEQLCCQVTLNHPPEFEIEISQDPFYRHLEKFWLLYQIPLAYLLYWLGGWSWVCAGIFLKNFGVHFGHWLMAWCLHNHGSQPNINTNAGVQGYNIGCMALMTLGESYHNNHHLFPRAARNDFHKGEVDPAWWLICFLEKIGLADQINFYKK